MRDSCGTHAAARQSSVLICRAPSDGGNGGNRDSRKVDREDAALPREVARRDSAVVLFDAPTTEGETQAQPRPIQPALLEGAEQLVEIPARQAAALNATGMPERCEASCRRPQRVDFCMVMTRLGEACILSICYGKIFCDKLYLGSGRNGWYAPCHAT